MHVPSTTRASPVSRFADAPPTLLAGRGAVAELETELTRADIEDVLVVCNRSIGELDAVLDPVLAGLGDRVTGVFAEASRDKRLETAIEAATIAREDGAHGIVGLGAGSALDVATVAAALVDRVEAAPAIRSAFLETGTVPLDGDPRPIVTIPTTFAGAEQSAAAGITAETDDGAVVSGGIGDLRLRPMAAVYDADLVAHTPRSILAASAMNGFNKGLEALYGPDATPVTDATALRGLSLLTQFLPELDVTDRDTLDAILEGLLLVQYGLSRPAATGLSIIHAIGHGVTAEAPVQQGLVHAVMTPPVITACFERAPCRRQLLAEAVGAASADGVAPAIASVRDALGLPDRLSTLDGIERSMLSSMAEATADDRLMANQPPGVDFDRDDILDLLESAW